MKVLGVSTLLALGLAACGPASDATLSGHQLAQDRADVSTSSQSQQGAEPCDAELRPLVEATMEERGVPGAIVRVEVPGRCRWTATLGFADVTTRRPMLLPDHVRVGSITKTFTGTVVLQLVDEECIGLDDPISQYLAGVPNGDAISIRQLLHMTSGLYNYSEDVAFNRSLDEDPQRVWSIAELLAIAFAHPPDFAPGAAFHYSNTNSILLGRLVEEVTGHPLREELRSRIFAPLHMEQTSLPELDDTSIPHPHPSGYMYGTNVGSLQRACDAATVGRHDVTYASPSWTWAAGGAISTLHDLTIWSRALALGTLLSEATQAQRLQWIAIEGSPAQYGLHITNFAGVIGHDGALPGFQSFMGYVPARDANIVILTNLDPDLDCGGPADEIAKAILKQLQLFSP